MSDRVCIPLPGIGTLVFTREQYDAALIPIVAPTVPEPPPLAATRQARAATSVAHVHENVHGLRYIRLSEVCARVGLRQSAIYHLIKLGRFPKQVKLSERTSAWIAGEVENFMDARIAERDSRLADAVPAPSPYCRISSDWTHLISREKGPPDFGVMDPPDFVPLGPPSGAAFQP